MLGLNVTEAAPPFTVMPPAPIESVLPSLLSAMVLVSFTTMPATLMLAPSTIEP